jgi:hypothetical protein
MPATRQRPPLEFLAMAQDSFPSAAVYIIRRDLAKDLVVQLGVVQGDEAGDLGLQFPRRLLAVKVVSARGFHETCGRG